MGHRNIRIARNLDALNQDTISKCSYGYGKWGASGNLAKEFIISIKDTTTAIEILYGANNAGKENEGMSNIYVTLMENLLERILFYLMVRIRTWAREGKRKKLPNGALTISSQDNTKKNFGTVNIKNTLRQTFVVKRLKNYIGGSPRTKTGRRYGFSKPKIEKIHKLGR